MQAWSKTEAGLQRALASYICNRFQRTKNVRSATTLFTDDRFYHHRKKVNSCIITSTFIYFELIEFLDLTLAIEPAITDRRGRIGMQACKEVLRVRLQERGMIENIDVSHDYIISIDL